MSPAGVPQVWIALGSVEVTDTDRRAIAWHLDGESVISGRLAARNTCRSYLLARGSVGLERLVSDYLDAGGQTASMEARSAASEAEARAEARAAERDGEL